MSALLGKSDDESLMKAQELTSALVTGARAAITDETKSYFEEVKFPNLLRASENRFNLAKE